MELLALLALCLLAHLNQVSGTSSSPVSEECLLDDDQTTARLDTCLQDGHEFVTRLLEHSRGNTRRRKRFDLCQSFLSFKECFDPILKGCSEQRRRLHKDWAIIYDVVNCACNGTNSCKDSLNCFLEQIKGTLGRQCDAQYRFNSKQDTLDRCHFLYEAVRCKEALVESACSPEGGVFAFHVAKVANSFHIRRFGCVITRDQHYTGFRYTDKCPSNLTSVTESCKDEFISQKLEFRNDFDLIPSESKRKMREYCGHYARYRECVSNLESNCNHGLRKLYDFDGKLRTYLLKMEYICGEGKKGFNLHLRCYRELLENNTLARCNHIWRDLAPVLESVNAHHFYCRPESNITQTLRKSLAELRSCYEGVFATACPDGGAVVAQLMARVFEDPIYLRYRFQPDCQLHGGPALATGHPPTRPSPTRRPTAPRGKVHSTRAPRPEPKYVVQKDPSSTGTSVSSHGLCTVLTAVSLVLVTLHTYTPALR